MNIPRFWARARGTTSRPDGSPIELTAWGWSATDQADARKNAEDRLSRVMARVEGGDPLPDRYPYGVRALREEIIEQVDRGDGAAPAIVTRNSYGSLVINTPDVMFVDVDVAEPRRGFLGGLLSRARSSAEDRWRAIAEQITQVTSSTFRIYATAGGYRLFATERLFAPGSGQAERIMESVGVDQAYLQLCRAQKSFRARLTPKPWRAGHTAAPNQFPRDPREQAEFDGWLAKYEQRCAGRATCTYLGDAGTGRVAATVSPILRLHDERTRALESLPLA